MIDKERIIKLNSEGIKGGNYILYWMQQSQRTEYNHALEYSIIRANELNLPLLVYFGLTENFPDANERHFRFMLEGLKEVKDSLKERGILFIIRRESPEKGAIDLSEEASIVVTDMGYLRLLREWRKEVAENISCPLIQVESDVIVPVKVASTKEDYSAGTFRPKIMKKLDKFMHSQEEKKVRKHSTGMEYNSDNIDDIDSLIDSMDIDHRVKKVNFFRGGTSEAKDKLEDFIETKLDEYPDLRNDPSLRIQSDLSPYLHFGQISPLCIAIRVLEEGSRGVDDYLEQLIVRRELSINFVYYNRRYDSLEALPDWALKTLSQHSEDRREYIYNCHEFENSLTHDRYWNAAQREMVVTGKMHGYMRMYWGKKIIEWSDTPEKALQTAIYLNNKYELDGRDPNGYTGILWCFGKHDRAWKERNIFGKVRYMSAGGLERKFDISSYADMVESL